MFHHFEVEGVNAISYTKPMGKKSAPLKKSPIRRPIRFVPDALTIATLSTHSQKDFKPNMVALVLNESFSGCALLVNGDNVLKKEQKVMIKLGQLDAMPAKIAWVKNLEESIYKIGVQFLE